MSARGDFWSRRKAAVAAEQEAEIVARDAAIEAQQTEALEERSDEDILAELNLKDPDTLEAGDDFSVFLQKAVPERIRRRALRKLWLSDPTLANLDNLVDYGEDYTDAATVVENLSTAYQVGKGMLKHVLEMERQEAEENAPETAGDLPEEELATSQATIAHAPEASDAPGETPIPETLTAESEPEADEVPVRRRMRFTPA